MQTWIILAVLMAVAIAVGLLIWKRSAGSGTTPAGSATGRTGGATRDLSRKPELDDR